MNDFKAEPNLEYYAPITSILCLIVPFFAGILTAPFVFNGMVRLGRSYTFLAFFRDIEFERVASRCVLLFALLGIYPALKYSGLQGWSAIGLTRTRSAVLLALKGFFLGVVTLGALYFVGYLSDALPAEDGTQGVWIRKVSGFLGGALAVGIIEEILFRGALLSIFKKMLGFWGGAILSSLIFASLHFAKPVPEVGVVYGHWHSGFDMMPYMFRFFAEPHQYFPFILTLFFMGIMLCQLRELSGNLYMAVGLHAGWVWLIQSGAFLLNRNPDTWAFLYGPTESVEKSYVTLILSAFLVTVMIVLQHRRKGHV